MFVTVPSKLRPELVAINIKTGSAEEGIGKETIDVDIRLLDSAKLDEFYNVLKKYPEARSARIHINAYKRGKEAPAGKAVETLRAAAGALAVYIVEDAIEGWLFKMSENPIAALVTGVTFHPAIRKRDYEREAYIEISLIQNDRGKTQHKRIEIKAKNTNGQTVENLLSAAGWQKETEELHELYQEELARYKDLKPRFGEQLILRGERLWSDDEDEYRYWGRGKKAKINLKDDNGGRLVNDEEPVQGSFQVSVYRYDDPENPYIQDSMQPLIEEKLGKGTKAFSNAPFVMNMKCFHLGQHSEIELHVRDVELYEYDDKMRSKLILPEMYGEVLDVLTDEMNLVQEDMVQGKSGGNIILLAGPPGTGKTLTAEVYAEFRHVALLRVHSGQLGTTPDSIEKKLMQVYKRAVRWGIPVLIDEFDVFGRARGADLEQNAVVAVFLRTMEYFNGTIFLTTNRSDDMDDAILSRCAAIIKYGYPEPDVLKEIWYTQRDQFLPDLTDEVIEELMKEFRSRGKECQDVT